MPRRKTSSRRSAAPPQLYVIRKILKDSSLINDYFYKAPKCPRGHEYRRIGEHWCLLCACAILQGKCGIELSEVDTSYRSRFMEWNRINRKKTFQECWSLATTNKSSRFHMPTYKRRDKKQPDYLSSPKAAYSWYWGDTGRMPVTANCGQENCTNPLHLSSVFNYPYQTLKENKSFGTTSTMFNHCRYVEYKKDIPSMHEYLRALMDESYLEETFSKGFYCPWGHTLRNSEEGWCYKCVSRITAGSVGFDINYLIPVYRWAFNEYFGGIKRGNFDECWVLPENMRLSVYRVPSHMYEQRKHCHLPLGKAIYNIFWGDVGSVRVNRTCKEKWCWNPLHYYTIFNDPEIDIKRFNHCIFDLDGDRYSEIAQKRLDYAKQRLYLPLPWEKETHLTNEESASGVIPFLEAHALSA
jgi:hypothetical protein